MSKKGDSFLGKVISYIIIGIIAIKIIVEVIIPAIIAIIAAIVGLALFVVLSAAIIYFLFMGLSLLYEKKISPWIEDYIYQKRAKVWDNISAQRGYNHNRRLKLGLENEVNKLTSLIEENENFLKECELILMPPVLHLATKEKTQYAIADLQEENTIHLEKLTFLRNVLQGVSNEEIRIANEKSEFLKNGKIQNNTYNPSEFIIRAPNGGLRYKLGQEFKEKYGEKSYHDSKKAIFFQRLYEESRNPRHPDPNYLNGNPLTDEQKADQVDRFIQAHTLTSQIPPKYADALNLYRPDIDFANTGWLLLVGWIFDQHFNNNTVFDPELAFQFYVEASRLGCSAASYNLALKYSSGNEGPIDVNAAAFWLKKATEQDSPQSEYELAKLYKDHDGRFWSSKEEVFKNNVYQLIDNSFGKGSMRAMNNMASFFSTGRHFDHNPQAVIELYNRIIAQEAAYHEESSRYEACLKFALRFFLGFNVEQSFNKVQELLDMIPEKSNHSYVRYTLNDNSTILKAIMNEYISSEEVHINAWKIVLELYQGKTNHQDVHKIIGQISHLPESL